MLDDLVCINSQNLEMERCRTEELMDSVCMRKPSLALDLDDTLICSYNLPSKSHDFQVIVKRRRVFIAVRPGLQQFLEKISQIYEVFIYTNAEKEYADKVLNIIAPDIDEGHRLYRDQCKKFGGYSVKDLSTLHRPIHRILLVDDTPSNALLQPPNLIHISPFTGDVNDSVLLQELLPALRSLAEYQNIVEASYETISSNLYPSLRPAPFYD